jgi:hypothetical protein
VLKRLLNCCLAALTVLCGHAMADIWEVSLLPGDSISGPAGSTIGWGYSITNESTTQWLVLENLTESPFQDVSSLDSVFDYPIVAPGETVAENYLEGTSGLLGLTWSSSAPLYFVDSGDFVFSADWYSGDPLAGGVDLGGAPENTVDYTAQVLPAQAAVPEPSAVVLLGTILVIIFLKLGRAGSPI